jgi:two-component system, OmpR family, sensor histidine kinase QseC
MKARGPRKRFHSLTRRVTLTICGALGLVWVCLMAFELLQTRLLESENPALELSAAQMLAVLTSSDDPGAAARVIQGLVDAGKSRLRKAHVDVATFIQIRDRRTGRIVFRSPEDLQRLPPLAAGYSRQVVAGTSYHAYLERYEPWEIAVGQANIPTSFLLMQQSREMTTELLVAVPFLLVPVWLAVWLGLRPLHRLANSISKRDPDDLSPVQVTQRHAELTLLADAFNLQLAKVSRLIARERAFLQDAAHELRTPMAVVAVNAHAVANARTAEERAAAEARLHSGLSRTSHLVEQLLALTRLDVGRPGEMALRDVVPLVRDDLAAAAPTAVARQIDLALEAPDCLNRPVEFHALHSIVGNLVNNAIQYGRQGGRVIVTLGVSGEGWTLSVADDGTGIPVADRARVFERFYRGDPDETQWTGLGLAIVRAAAARLGGTVRITDGLDGRGSTFIVQFSMTGDPEAPGTHVTSHNVCVSD